MIAIQDPRTSTPGLGLMLWIQEDLRRPRAGGL
jgi:ABC-type thiamine transport system substrate-binding protein